MTRCHSSSRLRRLSPGLLALLLSFGCATTQPEEDPELKLRRSRSHFDMAVDHMQNDRVELALRELYKAETYDPDNARIQHGMAIALLQKGKTEEGEARLRRALEIAPAYQEARFNLSTLLMNLGRYEECIEQAKILYDDPTYTSPWRALTNWGWAAHQLGRNVEARRNLEFARDSSPHYWPTLLNLGILEAEAGNRSEAIQYFSHVLKLDPGPSATAEASYRLAEIYVSLGKRREAVGHLRTAVVKAPGDPWGKKSEAYLKLLR